jgi:DUF4097 and DUF4098 domain-containing protein YvlB
MKKTLAFLILTLAGSTVLPAQARQSDDFTWSGRVASGRWIRVRNLNGGITIGPATGDRVEVIATKRWRRGNPEDVTVEVKKTGANEEDVLVCALWFDNTLCNERQYEVRSSGRNRNNNNDVNVEIRVLVPKGVKVGLSTVNGTVVVDGATAAVDAETVNGRVEVTTDGGPVNANTVNGTVRARVGRIDSSEDMSFSTVNGSVIAEFVGDVSADVDLSTVNGSLRTDFEITLTGRLDPKHLRAHIGRAGGPRIKLSTVNGSVELRRR